MLYYTITLQCRFCKARCPWAVAAETEPPPDTVIEVICPEDNSAVRVRFHYFKPTDALPPGVPVTHYPPRPASPPPPPSQARWWQFWKR